MRPASRQFHRQQPLQILGLYPSCRLTPYAEFNLVLRANRDDPRSQSNFLSSNPTTTCRFVAGQKDSDLKTILIQQVRPYWAFCL
jgi:hypothetical protein